MLAEMVIELGLKASEFQKGIGEADKSISTFSTKMSKVGEGMKKAGTALTLGVTLPIVGMAAEGVKSAIAFQAATAQVAAGLKSTGDAAGISMPQVVAHADAIEKMSGMSKTAEISGSTLLITLGGLGQQAKGGSEIFSKAAAVMGDMDARLGGAGSSARILARAMADPIKGTQSLTRYGVTLTAQQKAQVKAFADSGNKMGAQQVILQALSQKFGGAAKAMGQTTAGQLNIAKASFEDLTREAVTPLLPLITSFARGLQGLTEWFGKLSPGAQKFIVLAVIAAAALGPMSTFIGSVATALGVLGTAFATEGEEATVAWTATLGPIALIIAAIAAVVAVGILLYQHWDTIKTLLLAAWTAIKTAVTTVWTYVKDFIAQHILLIVTLITGPIGGLVVWMIQNWTQIQTDATTVWTAITGAIRTAVGAVATVITTVIGAVVAVVQAVWNAISTAVTTTWGIIATVMSAAVGLVVSAITLQIHAVVAVVEAVWTAIHVGITTAWGLIRTTADTVAGWIVSALTGPINAIEGTISGVWMSVKTGLVSAWGVIKTDADTAVRKVTTAFTGIVTFFSGIGTSISTAAAGGFDGLWDAFKSAVDQIISAWNGLSFSLPEIDTKIPGVGKVGGMTISTPNIPLLANGGVATSATLAVIGEAGPEAVIPLSKAGSLLGGGGPSNVTVTINNPQIGNGYDVRQLGQQLVNELRLQGVQV